MPQVIEFLPVSTSSEARLAIGELVRVCKETQDGDAFKDFQLEAGIEVLKAKIESREPKVEARVLKRDAKTQED